MRLFVNTEIGGVIKVYTFPRDDRQEWTKREIVADFVDSPAGRAAYAAFVAGIARSATRDVASIYDYQTGKCLAGTLGELDR